MKSRILAVLLITLSTTAYSASFDCGKAKSKTEKIICSDSALGALDERLASTYTGIRNNLSKEAKEKFRSNQANWIKLNQLCSDDPTGKDAKRLATCLSLNYTNRIKFLSGYIKPISGMYKYPSLNGSEYGSTDIFDGGTPNAVFINDIITKMGGAEKGDDLDITISSLGSSIVMIDQSGESNGGAHPSFFRMYDYIDTAKSKVLASTDFFQRAKLRDLSKAILKEIRVNADKDTLECLSGVDEDSILEEFSPKSRNVGISLTGIHLVLGAVPSACRAVGSVSISMKIINPYISDMYKSLFKK